MDVDYRPDEEVDETCRPNVTESPSHVSNHSPQSIKETDRKEFEEMLSEKNSKIKQLEDQLAKQRDYEQIKNELNLLKEQISLLRNEKQFDLLLSLDKSRSMANESNNSAPKLPNIQNMDMFTSLLGEELIRGSLFRGQRPADKSTPNELNNLFNNNGSSNNLLDSSSLSNTQQRITPPNLRRPQSADDLKHNLNNSNSNQSANSSLTHHHSHHHHHQHNLPAGLTPEALVALDNDLIMAKNNPSISQLTTSISSSLIASTVSGNNQYSSLSNNNNNNLSSNTPATSATSSSSSLQIPQLDPMLTVTTPAAQAALIKLTEKLRHNVDRYMNQNLNTQNISRCVRELLSVHNIGQRLFAKYVLGLSQGTVSELLSKPKQWDKLTEKGRDSYRKMHAWASDEDCIWNLKCLVPKKGKEVYNTGMISSTMTNTASMITGNAVSLANGGSPVGNQFNNNDPADRLQALLKAQSLFNNNSNHSNSNNNVNPMLELMASSGANNSQQQQLMELLLKSQQMSSSANNNQIGNNQQQQQQQQQFNPSNLDGDCSQMSDELDSKERSMTPLDSIYKKLTNGMNQNQNDPMQEAMMTRLCQEQIKLFAAQMEESMRQQQSNNNNNNNNNDKSDEFRQAFATYQNELAKLTSSNFLNQANQERLLMREGNVSRDSNSSFNDELKSQNQAFNSSNNSQQLQNSSGSNHLNNSLNNSNNQQQSNSAFPMVKSFLNSSNNGSTNLIKNEDSCSGKSTPLNNSSNGGQPEDLSGVVSSPLQRIQSITNSLLISHPNASTSPNRAFGPNSNNSAAAGQSKAILPPITQNQFDLYNNLNTEDIVKKVKEQLSQYSISQRLFGESVLGLSQGSVSDLLARPKPWHMLTQKGREPFIRMRMFLEDENAVHKLVASQYKIAPDKLMRTGSYASTGTNGSQIPSALTNDLNQLSGLSGLAALSGNLPSNALNALTAMDGSIAAAVNGNNAFATALLLASQGNRNLLNLDTLKLLERHQAGSPNQSLNNSLLLDSVNTQRSSANSTPDNERICRSPSLNNSASSPKSFHKRSSSTGPLSLNGCLSSNNNDYNSHQSLTSSSSYSQPQSVYEMAALTDTLDTQDVTTKIKESLMQHNIGQKIFGEVVLGLSQGSVSELLSKPKPWSMLSIKGREPFIRMKMWLTDPNNIEKLQSLKNERREANKRRRNADVDPVTGFSMDKLMSTSNSGSLENGSNEIYNSNTFGSNNPAANLNSLLANLNSNQFNLSNNFGPQSAKKPRILFSDEQKEALKIAFQMDSYPTTTTIEQLSNELQLSVRTITNWFHNHRMRLKQVNSSSNNNVSSPDENSSNYSFNGRENSNSTFDIQQFRTLLDQRINELKLNPANKTQSTIQMSKGGSSNHLNNLAFNLYNPQLMELIRNGGDLSSISSLMNSLANNSCVSPSSSNQEEYYQDDDTMEDDEVAGDHNNDGNNFQSTLDLSVNSNGGLKTRQKLQQHLQRRINSEDECNYSENDEDDLNAGDLDENSNDFENNSMLDEKRSKLMLTNSGTSRRKTAQPQYVNPKDNLEDADKLAEKQSQPIDQ